MISQLVNISTKELENKFVYRIFTFDNFIDLIASNKISLVHPKLWDDPFENLLLANNYSFENLKRCFFGQCWSHNRETDFMWRVYAPNKNGIKIKCSLKNLCNHLFTSCNDFSQHIFFGNVNYKKKSNLIEDFKKFNIDHDKKPIDLIEMVKFLYIKRNEFSAEKEFRIVYYNHKLQFEKEKHVDIFKLDIDKNNLFESITCDPRISNTQFKHWKLILKKFNVHCPIYKSKLYTLEI